MQVCLSTNHLLWNTTLGGHAWVFLNWALGLKAAGAKVVLLEKMRWADDPQRLFTHLRQFYNRLGALGLEAEVMLIETEEQTAQLASVRSDLETLTAPLERVFAEADLFLNFKYAVPQEIVDRFKRSALVDIDPGLLQSWIVGGTVSPARHDMNFTIGETVGQPGSKFPDCGMKWHYTPPPVHLPSWPVTETPADACFTTVTNWWGEYELLGGESINNEKRTNFIANLNLPSLTRAKLELAIYHEDGNSSDMPLLTKNGWQTRPAYEVSATVDDYRNYIRGSRGEFSCAKESCMVLQNAWISDRTICYLASGKPAVVQHTGPSRFLPDKGGLWRFTTMQQAARFLDHIANEENYEAERLAARAIAEENFDAEKVMTNLLATAMSQKTKGHRVH
jgi:hypothetical protein